MSHCAFCYEMPPVCSAGRGGAVACSGFLAGSLRTLRGANGVWAAEVRNALPNEFGVVDDEHFDSVTGYAPTSSVVAPVMTEGDAAVRLKLTDNTSVRTELGELANYVADHPEDFVAVGRNVRRLYDTLSATQHQTATAIMLQVEQARQISVQPALVAAPAKNSAQYKQRAEPLTALLQQLVRRVENGEPAADDSSTVFDPATGRTLTPFAKAVKVSSGANLIYAVNLLVVFCTSVMKKAPKVYFRFMEVIVQITNSHGHVFAHKLADAMLRKLDVGHYDSPISLMKAGEHNMIIDSLLRMQNTAAAAAGGPRFSAFGDVTVPIGGPGAGITTDPASGLQQQCLQFHASPKKKCTAGVPVGHPSGMAGQCMYKH